MLISILPMLIAAQSSVWYATALKARYGKNVTDILAGGNSVTEINPMYNCEVVTLDPVTVHNFEGPALDLEIIVEMRNLWLDPYGANTGWTLEPNAPSGIEFIAYKHTATVPTGNSYTAPPFRFILTVGDNSGHFNIHLGTQSTGTAYSFLGNALSEPAITLTGLVSDLPASIKPDCNPFNGPVNPLYLVTDNLIVDENLCLTPSIDPNFPTIVKRAKVFVQSGHAITITDNALFSIKQADFQGCEFLWKGIVVEPSGRLIADQAEIRDAYDGVEIQRGAQARIENSAFYNNVRGLFVNGNDGTGNPPFLETCFGNTFATLVADGDEWPMKQSANTAQLPNPVFKRAEQGIFAEDASFIITSDNTFQRLARYGIHALRTNTEVYESVFSRINPSESYFAQSGTGVFFREGNVLTVTGAGNGANDPVGFEHLTTGIFALKPIEFNVTDCKMENIRQGMMLNGGIWPEVLVQDNHINAHSYAVRGFQNGIVDPGSAGVRNNIISIDGDLNFSAGVRLEEYNVASPHNYYWKISNNQITLKKGRYGIRSLSGNRYLMQGNSISIANLGQPDAEGFHLESVSESRFDCNAVSVSNGGSDNIYPGQTAGFYSAAGFTNDYLCNGTDNSYYGFLFRDMAQDHEVKGNTIGNHWLGLSLGKSGLGSASIGVQGGQGAGFGNEWEVNVWLDETQTAGRLGAKHWSSNPDDWDMSKFFVPNLNTCPAYNPKKDPASQWFSLYGSCTVAYTCSATCPPAEPPPPRESSLDEYDYYIASGGTVAGGYLPGMRGRLEMNLYRRLMQTPALRTDSLMSAFVAAQENAPIGQFFEVELGIRDLLLPADTATLRAVRDTLGARLSALEALNDTAGAMQEALRALLASDALLYGDSLLGLRNAMITWRQAQADTLLQQNAAINALASWELNYQFALDCYLRLLKGETPDSAAVQGLYALANTCPLTGGDGVYLARSLYADQDPEATFDDDLLCDSVDERRQLIENAALASAVSLFPNPGSGVFSIQGLSDEAVECLVFDAQGRMVRQAILTEPVLDLSVLPEGAYSVRVVQQGKTHNIKVIILN